jgi:hypothetical protein
MAVSFSTLAVRSWQGRGRDREARPCRWSRYLDRSDSLCTRKGIDGRVLGSRHGQAGVPSARPRAGSDQWCNVRTAVAASKASSGKGGPSVSVGQQGSLCEDFRAAVLHPSHRRTTFLALTPRKARLSCPSDHWTRRRPILRIPNRRGRPSRPLEMMRPSDLESS